MPVVVDLYTARQSWVHAVDPRVKLLFVACFILLLLVFNNLFFMLVVLTLLHLLHWSAEMPGHKLAFIWKTLLPVSILICVLWTVFYPTGSPIFEFWVIRITLPAVAQGLVLGLRIISMAFVVFAWLYTTDQPSLIRSLVKLKMPYEWGLVLALALRYIPTFQGTYSLISEAQQARGLELSGGGFKRVKLMMPIFVAMIITSLRASEQLAKALEARAFGAPGVQRSTLHDIHFRPVDYLIGFLILAITVGLLYLNLRYGIGEQPI
jgi:energy-coupling factor transporter transmembrane protein EcfT